MKLGGDETGSGSGPVANVGVRGVILLILLPGSK